jgi:putative DNA methylase
MPDNGMQCVMFTHQDTGVWSDLVRHLLGRGTAGGGGLVHRHRDTSELKKGGYVQGTVTLMLRKRPAGDRHRIQAALAAGRAPGGGRARSRR